MAACPPDALQEPLVEPLFSPTPAEVEERMQRELFSELMPLCLMLLCLPLLCLPLLHLM
jgi:hypothetical protein